VSRRCRVGKRPELSISPYETLGPDALKEWGGRIIRLEQDYIRAEDRYRKTNSEEDRQSVLKAREVRDEAMELKIKLDELGGEA
jgi:hypothetical protein